MCLATPLQIEKIEKGSATVSHSGKDYEVSLQLIPQARVGDWILTHGELAISIIPEEEASEILKLIKKSGSSCSL